MTNNARENPISGTVNLLPFEASNLNKPHFDYSLRKHEL